ncbi:class F sortase [Bacillus sp. NTK071]|uniref:class F sortase n=1 Tax=Bacillus sp. NTK071 TaxID=2802175 RepID=UPI001A8C4743|nr:class F sortase [Bacillus sp. NTK071]MBN8210609.1 class F sortase [Bacillus sp. NTK071]
MPLKKLLTISLLMGAAAGCSSFSNHTSVDKGVPSIEEVQLNSAPEIMASSKSNDINAPEPKGEGIVPKRLSIPAINVDAEVEHVGQLPDGQMDVPKNDDNVGWYQLGAKPGEMGNAVLAGHVDNKTGPSVFFHLGDLEKGDIVAVSDQNGKAYKFEVQKVESYPRNEAPLEKVFGTTSISGLNLITCTGTFNRDAGTHEERLVVYTTLVSK